MKITSSLLVLMALGRTLSMAPALEPPRTGRLSDGTTTFQLSDPTPVSSMPSAFYRACAVPFAQSLDVDGDGIDDGYELHHRAFLDLFKTGDAALDFDGDGRTNLEEYREGTDPATAP